MQELTDTQIQEIINKNFDIVPCSQEARNDRSDLILLIGTVKSLREQLITANEKIRQYELLLLNK